MVYIEVMIEMLVPKYMFTIFSWALSEARSRLISVPIEIIRTSLLGFWRSIGQNKSQNHQILTTFNKTFPLRMTGDSATLRQ